MSGLDRPLRTLPLLWWGFLLAAAVAEASPTDLDQVLRSRGLEPAAIVRPEELTAEMRVWLGARVPATGTADERLERLLAALRASSFPALRYQPGYTGTAREVFESGRFNCLSFSHLFVGMARELGIETYYLRVDRRERFEKDGNLVVVAGHMTAGFGPPSQVQFLEFGTPTEDTSYRTAQRVSDVEALALFYTNRGAELLRAGEVARAREWLGTAARIEPGLAEAWVNLGVALRRLGEIEEAEAAYWRAIELDGQELSAYRNLAALQRMRGDAHAAQSLLRLLDRRDNRNPFTYLALGDLSLADGQLEDARRFYRRARRLDRGHPEILAAMGEWALAAGDLDGAWGWLEQARAADPGNARVLHLAAGVSSGAPPER